MIDVVQTRFEIVTDHKAIWMDEHRYQLYPMVGNVR